MREEQPPTTEMITSAELALAADQSWHDYLCHVSERPNCMSGVDCRIAERLYAAWKAAKRAVRAAR